ncbi:PD-(D/E)XK nuclease family protein [Nocardia aurantia]|uniref:PD-(D/E)XK nuclease family protein n=1 Tax=Nocardia aurantia TaxID=2585199 RepID=UPI001296D217|nr:PD-(D/E)XK nuclease family protein [Nocardia aurantia]
MPVELIRVGAGNLLISELACPRFLAAKARPAIRVGRGIYKGREQLADFALGTIMDIVSRVEFDRVDEDSAVSDPSWRERHHAAVVTFIEHAVRAYVNMSTGSGIGRSMRPVRGVWVAGRQTQSKIWEMYAWGRGYESLDGTVREFRFIRSSLRNARDPRQVAVAAYAAAFGVACKWSPSEWGEPFAPIDSTVPPGVGRVRIVEVCLFDGEVEVLFDGTPAVAESLYRSVAADAVKETVYGTDTQPGRNCLSCKIFGGTCRDITDAPGLLGVTAERDAPYRTVSISTLRYYRDCPARMYLYGAGVPRIGEYSDLAGLGQAVHGRLAALHARGAGACCVGELPSGDDEWAAEGWTVRGELARCGAEMLRHHLQVCPFDGLDLPIGEVLPEPTLVFHDRVARAIVVAKPDLLYQESGSWVWREVKTTQSRRDVSGVLLSRFPQLALATVLLADGRLGGDGRGSRVELELLRPDRAELWTIDPSDSGRVAEARETLRQLSSEWRDDLRFEARPGKTCQWCPVSLWCADRSTVATYDEEDARDEYEFEHDPAAESD